MPIIINNFHKGQTSSPYVADGAYAKSANLDVFSQPGIARINYLPDTQATSPFTARPSCIVDRNNLTLYAADRESKTYVTADGGATWAALTASKGKYLAYWKGHLFAVGNNATINTYEVSVPEWGTIADPTTDVASFIFVSKNDDKVYIANANYVATVEENAGQNFDDDDAGTYTLTNKALTLPEDATITCLAEQRENILIGGSYKNRATIFIWDRERSEFDYPISVPEPTVNAMWGEGDKVYISAGRNGKIYLFSESGFVPYATIGGDYENRGFIDVYRYGMNWWKDRLLVGASRSSNSTSAPIPMGVYGIKDGKVNCEHLISSGEDGTNDDVEIGVIYAFDGTIDNSMLVGYYDKQNTDYAIDLIKDNDNRVTTYGSYFESLFYRAGKKTTKSTFTSVEVQLSRPLQTGEGVRIKYRTEINGAWVTLGTFDYTTQGAKSSHIFSNIVNVENIQLRVELTTGASKNTPYLLELRLE